MESVDQPGQVKLESLKVLERYALRPVRDDTNVCSWVAFLSDWNKTNTYYSEIVILLLLTMAMAMMLTMMTTMMVTIVMMTILIVMVVVVVVVMMMMMMMMVVVVVVMMMEILALRTKYEGKENNTIGTECY